MLQFEVELLHRGAQAEGDKRREVSHRELQGRRDAYPANQVLAGRVWHSRDTDRENVALRNRFPCRARTGNLRPQSADIFRVGSCRRLPGGGRCEGERAQEEYEVGGVIPDRRGGARSQQRHDLRQPPGVNRRWLCGLGS